MKSLLILAVITVCIHYGNGYSKYGRTCKDIGCLSNEQCIMAEDPCSYYSRDDCGLYPTCQKVTSASATCATFVCPPTKKCRMDGSTPKCVDDERSLEHQNSFSNNNPIPQNGYPDTPNAPPNPQPGMYPQIPGQTTTRSPMYRPAGYPNGGGGYQGGSIGSGYPGQPSGNGYSGYPSQQGGNGYPAQGGYPGYPAQGQNGRYPSNGYPAQSGGNGYPGYSGYPSNTGGQTYTTYNNPYGSSTASNPIVDTIKNTLKTYGLFYLLIKYVAGDIF